MFIGLFFSCGSEDHNDLGLGENEIAYYLDNGTTRTFSSQCVMSKEGEMYKLSIKAAQNSEGVIITIKNVVPYVAKQYPFRNDVSIVLNEKIDKDLNIYVSSACKENKGVFEIVDWNKKEQTLSGKFSGPLCTRGIFAHLPGASIDEAGFYKLKYSEQ